MKKLIPLALLFSLFLSSCSLRSMLFGPDPKHPEVVIIDLDFVPMQLVDTEKDKQIEGKFMDINTGIVTVKKVNVSEYQGWYMLNPRTFKKLVESGKKQRVIVLRPESDPFTVTANNDIEVLIRMLSVDGQDEVVKKTKIKDYIDWVVIHPHMYKRLVQAALPNK